MGRSFPILIVVMLFLSTTRIILETEAKPKPENALNVTVDRAPVLVGVSVSET